MQGRNQYRHKYMLTECPTQGSLRNVPLEQPPAYAVTSSTSKRPRQPSSTPPSKRVLCSHTSAGLSTKEASIESTPNTEAVSPSAAHEIAISDPGSPTEKATTASTPSSKAALSPFTPTPVPRDVLDEITENILERFPKSPFCSPASSCADRQKPGNANVATYIHALHALLSTRDSSRVEAHLENIYESVVLNAEEARESADVMFGERLDEFRLEFVQEKENGIVEVNAAIDEGLSKLRELKKEYKQEVDEAYAQLLQELNNSRGKIGRSYGGSFGEEQKGEDERWRKARQSEIALRGRESDVLERERDLASRERDVACRERGVSERERELFQRESKLCDKERSLAEGKLGSRAHEDQQ